jgi:hypothetical protein
MFRQNRAIGLKSGYIVLQTCFVEGICSKKGLKMHFISMRNTIIFLFYPWVYVNIIFGHLFNIIYRVEIMSFFCNFLYT